MNSFIIIFSVLLSDEETKSPGPFEETCRFSISPKSLIRGLQALRHVFIKILIIGESKFHSLTLLIYSKLLLSIKTFSPLSTNGGTFIFIPQSKIAGL